MHPSWQEVLAPELEKDYFRALVTFVRRERSEGPVYPAPADVFRAFDLTPLDQVKVVILGQDPYPSPGHAHGLAFSVRPGVILPPSLVNIYRELVADVGFQPPGHGCLETWARRGVLLLNSVLTVRGGFPGSHADQGWETFTDAAVRALAQGSKEVVFLLWGGYARDKTLSVDLRRHAVFTSAHPSPRSADRGFFGSKPFSSANQALLDFGSDPVDWQISKGQ